MDLGVSDDGNHIIISRIHEGGVTFENGMLSEGDQVCVRACLRSFVAYVRAFVCMHVRMGGSMDR